MNCRDSESLILAERDGALTKDQLAALSDHVASCAGCRQLRATLALGTEAYRAAVAAVSAPDADEAWRELRERLRETVRRGRHPLAPVIWWGAPLAAAAALLFAFFVTRPAPLDAPEVTSGSAIAEIAPPPPLHDPSFIAGADFVEAGDPEAATIVFVDKESGWLVVWATNPDAEPRG